MRSAGMSRTPTSDAMITQVVGGDAVARRAQAVAIEHGADQRAVGEGDRRRAVPRLHQRRVVLVERAHRRIHRRVARPRLRESSSAPRAAASGPAITRNSSTLSKVAVSLPPGRDHRQHLREVVAEDARLQQAFARPHPVDVAAQRVDLAVVRDEAIRMRQRPRRERVGREALVHERERRLEASGRTGRGTCPRSATPSACPCR